METKKHVSKDLSRKQPLFFTIGLGISVIMVITAFEWRSTITPHPPRIPDFEKEELLVIPITHVEEPAKQPVTHILPKSKSPVMEFIEAKNDPMIDDNPQPPDMGDPNPDIEMGGIEIPEDTASIVTSFPEKHAEPVGGYETFYKQLQKTLVYPKRARQIQVEGTVFVEFIVHKNGEPSNFQVLRGIGAGCDEEAVRAISKTKWNPGKQRGKPVRVKMVLPIQFKLG
jgi:periplasmic protein TonB